MLFRLCRFYARDSLSSRTWAFFAAMLLMTGFLLWGMPSYRSSSAKVFTPVRLSVVDEDESFISRTLIDQFSNLSVVDAVYVETLPEARRRLADNEILLILVFPADFYEQSMQGIERSPLTVYLNERMPAETALFTRLLNNAAGSVVAIQSSFYAYQDLMRPLIRDDQAYLKALDVSFTNLAFQLLGRKSILNVNSGSSFNTVHHVVSSMVCLLAMMTGLLVLMQVQQERRSGLHERLMIANVSWWRLMLAKQLVGLVWLGAGFIPLFAGLFIYFPAINRPAAVLAVLALYWTTALICQMLGYLGKPGEAMLLAAWLGLLALLLLGGCIYPRLLLPDFLQIAGLVSPAHWAYLALDAALSGQSLSPAIPAAGLLMIILFTLAVWFCSLKTTSGQ
ncbi:MAG: ABC transporter permease [Clostridiaceae bacterium]|nr:ABC transporter permease [Clostridiaceae bacterium]